MSIGQLQTKSIRACWVPSLVLIVEDVMPLTTDTVQLVTVKNGQKFIFRYCPGSELKVLREIARQCEDREFDLSWPDAAVLSMQMPMPRGPNR